MAITAIALLKIPNLPAPAGMRVEQLADASLLHTGAPFASDPEELCALLEAVLGPLLAQHLDPRGVLFLPDVAAPRARSYAAVVEEVGEGGVWAGGPREADAELAFAMPDALGALSAALGSIIENMPPSVLAAADAAAHGDAAAFRSVSEQLAAMLGQPEAPLQELASMLGAAGPGPASPGLRELLPKLEQDFLRDPRKLQQLAAQLFGDAALSVDDDEE